MYNYKYNYIQGIIYTTLVYIYIYIHPCYRDDLYPLWESFCSAANGISRCLKGALVDAFPGRLGCQLCEASAAANQASQVATGCVCFRKRFRESDYYDIAEKTLKHELVSKPQMHVTNCGMVTPTPIFSCGNLQPPWSLKTRWYRQPLRARRHGASSGSAWHQQMLKGVVFSRCGKGGFCRAQSLSQVRDMGKEPCDPKGLQLKSLFSLTWALPLCP